MRFEGTACTAQRHGCVEKQIWGWLQTHFCYIDDPQEHSHRYNYYMKEVWNNQDSS